MIPEPFGVGANSHAIKLAITEAGIVERDGKETISQAQFFQHIAHVIDQASFAQLSSERIGVRLEPIGHLVTGDEDLQLLIVGSTVGNIFGLKVEIGVNLSLIHFCNFLVSFGLSAIFSFLDQETQGHFRIFAFCKSKRGRNHKRYHHQKGQKDFCHLFHAVHSFIV